MSNPVHSDPYRSLFENSHAVMLLIDPATGEIVDANPAATVYYGYSRDELLDLKITDVNILSPEEVRAEMQLARSQAKTHFRFRHRLKSGEVRDVDVYSGPVSYRGRDLLFSVIHDVTEASRAEEQVKHNAARMQALIELEILAVDADEATIISEGIESAERLTGSSVAFLHMFDPVTETIQLTNWSKATRKVCETKKDDHYPLETAGVWADPARSKKPVILNRFQELTERKGYPAEHIQIMNCLSVSVLEEDKVRMIMGVGNKLDDYEESDAQQLQVIANEVWRLVQHKRYERRLRESELRFRRLLEFAPDCVFVIDKDSKVIFTNETACKTFGYESNELIGQSIELLVPDRFKSMHPELCRGFIAKGTQRAMGGGLDLLAVRKDGAEIAVEISLSPIEHEDGRIVLVIVRDVTDRRAAQQALIYSQQRLALAMEATDAAVFDWDIRADTVYLSPSYFTILGHEPFHLPTDPSLFDHLFDMSSQARANAQFQALKNGSVEESTEEHLMVTKDGSKKWVMVSAKVVERTDSGTPARVVGTIQDVDQAHKLQEQFMQSQKMEAVGRLAGGIAHDFNNLLTAMIGNADLVLMDLKPGDAQYEEVLTIRNTANRAAHLTRQLLTLSRKHISKLVVLDLNENIENARKIYGRLLGEDLELKIVTTPGKLFVEADPSLIEQALLNLVVNARDAMPKGGQLMIETELIELDEKQVLTKSQLEPGKYVRLSVTDSGVGMDQNVKEHIFEPFFTTKETGSGLGLATVYGVVRQMHGAINVYSEVGKGTTFKIYLPSTGKMEPQEAAAPHEIAIPSGSGSIYVVDDEALITKLADTVLTGAGYTIWQFQTAESAESAFREAEVRPSCLVTDIVLPGMSGIDLAKRLRDIDPALKVVYMSGYTDERIKDIAELEHGQKFISKPFTPHDLAAAVRSVLGKTA